MAISLPLSSFWIWFYISEQYGIDIFRQSYIGCVILAITLTMGLVVIRYSPGGDGPMDLYMVVSNFSYFIYYHADVFLITHPFSYALLS